MGDIPAEKATQNVSIFDEENGNLAKVNANNELLVSAAVTVDTVKIEGDTSTNVAEVTNDNRLKTSTSISAIPETPVSYMHVGLLDGANSDMAVDGSVTPVDFLFAPPAGEIWYLEKISFIINDNGNSAPEDYGSIAGGLINGIEFEVRSNGVTRTAGLLKTNIEITQFFNEHTWTPTAGFMNGTNVFVGSIEYLHPFALVGDEGDYIQAKVQDDLTGLNFQRITLQMWREE